MPKSPVPIAAVARFTPPARASSPTGCSGTSVRTRTPRTRARSDRPAITRRAVRIVDWLELRRTPLPRRQEPLEIPLAGGVRIHAAPRLAGEPGRRQANQHAFGPALERGAQERFVALVQDVERPPEDNLHRRTIRSARYKRAHGDRRPSWIASKSEYTANAVWRNPGSRSTI